MASIFGQKTSFWWVSNQLIWTVPFESDKQTAERVRNQVRNIGKRVKLLACIGAAYENISNIELSSNLPMPYLSE